MGLLGALLSQCFLWGGVLGENWGGGIVEERKTG